MLPMISQQLSSLQLLKRMYLTFSLLVLSCAALIAFYAFYYQPKKACEQYVKTLTMLGYRVYTYPFKLLKAPFYAAMEIATDNKKDALHDLKYTYQGYDVVVSNIGSSPHIAFLNLKLGLQLTAVDKVNFLPKAPNLFSLFLDHLNKSVFYSEGKIWKQHKIAATKYFSFDFLKKQAPMIMQSVSQSFDRMEVESSQNDKNELQCDIYYTMGLNVFSLAATRCFLGFDILGEQIGDKPVGQFCLFCVLQPFSAAYNPFFLLAKWAYKLRYRKQHHENINDFKKMKQYAKQKYYSLKQQFQNMTPEQQNAPQNFIHSCLLQQKKDGEKSVFFKEEDIVQQIVLFFFAGAETTAALFTWMLIMTFDHPEIQSRIREQISDVLKNPEDFTFQNLKQMKYIDNLQLEAIRMLAPSISLFDRLATTDMRIGDIPCKKGTILNYFQTTNLYDQNIFPEPTKFKPERWAEKSEQSQNKLNLVMTTFGGGPRFCLGKSFALLQSKIAYISFIQRYKNMKLLHERQIFVDSAYHLKNSTATFERNK